jgi:hypothetical protein
VVEATHVLEVLVAAEGLVDGGVLAGEADARPGPLGFLEDVDPVDLAPLGPRTPRIWPRSTSKSTPQSALVFPKLLASPSATTAGTETEPIGGGPRVLPDIRVH